MGNSLSLIESIECKNKRKYHLQQQQATHSQPYVLQLPSASPQVSVRYSPIRDLAKHWDHVVSRDFSGKLGGSFYNKYSQVPANGICEVYHVLPFPWLSENAV